MPAGRALGTDAKSAPEGDVLVGGARVESQQARLPVLGIRVGGALVRGRLLLIDQVREEDIELVPLPTSHTPTHQPLLPSDPARHWWASQRAPSTPRMRAYFRGTEAAHASTLAAAICTAGRHPMESALHPDSFLRPSIIPRVTSVTKVKFAAGPAENNCMVRHH